MNKGISYLLGAFIVLIIGLVLLGVYADETVKRTQLITVTDTFSLAPARVSGAINNTYPFTLTKVNDAWRQDVAECDKDSIVTSDSIKAYNASGHELTMNGCNAGGYYFVEGVNEIYFCHNVDVNGTSNVTTVTYPNCPAEGYISNGWSKDILKITVGLLAVLCLAAVIAFLYLALKESGVSKF